MGAARIQAQGPIQWFSTCAMIQGQQHSRAETQRRGEQHSLRDDSLGWGRGVDSFPLSPVSESEAGPCGFLCGSAPLREKRVWMQARMLRSATKRLRGCSCSRGVLALDH